MPIDPFLKNQEGLEFSEKGSGHETSQEAQIVSRDHAPHFDCSEPNGCCIVQSKYNTVPSKFKFCVQSTPSF